jgi:hypothetical protein
MSPLSDRDLDLLEKMLPEAAQPRLPAPPRGGWRSPAAEYLKRGEQRNVLGSWEAGFLRGIARRARPPAPKQEAVLLRIAAAVGVPT